MVKFDFHFFKACKQIFSVLPQLFRLQNFDEASSSTYLETN